MPCPLDRQLQLYYDGELAASEREVFRRHLDGCAECVAELEQLRRMSEALLGMEIPAASADFLARLRQQTQWADRGVMRLARTLAAAASIVLVVGLIGLSRQQQTQAAAGPADWERVAVTLELEPATTEPVELMQFAELMVMDDRQRTTDY